MRIGYFINQYPKVSHSFIRREINALERLGVVVERFSVKESPEELVDVLDKNEFIKTRYLLNSSISSIIVAIIKSFFTPVRFFSALFCALSMGWKSDRGMLKHLFYFVEACLLKEWLGRERVDHVHAHFGTNSTAVVMLANKMGGPPYSFTVHGPEEFDKPEFLSLGKKIQSSAFVIAVSSYGRSQLFRWVESAFWGRIKVVHCGLDAAFYENAKIENNYSNNIVCVGRLCEQKGQLLLLNAVSRLVAEGVDLHLTLAGDGPMRMQIESMIIENRLQSNVTITGWISGSQVRDEVLRSRALVLPSFAEGLPVVIMEAMALQRPVLSTYVAGIPELVEPGVNGWLIPAGDVFALKAEIMKVLNTSNSELDRFGRNARERVNVRHNIDVEARKLYDLFIQSGLEKNR